MVTRVLVAVVVLGVPLRAQNRRPLLGIWASETTFGPAVRGTLTVQREGREWRAEVAGRSVRFRSAGDSVRFALPGEGGEFRGVVTEGGRVIAGFWIQPAGVVLGQAYATPLALQSVGRAVWRGMVVPLDDRFSLYLSISRGTDGSLIGVFRNPELNSIGGWPRFRVTRDADSVRFSARGDSSGPEIRLAGVLDPVRRRLTMRWDDLGRDLVLTPLAAEGAVGFFPRPPRGQPYRYEAPAAARDGWRTARAAAVGLDETVLARLVQRIIDTDPTAPRAPLMHSVLIARHGRLVLEEYFYGFDREQPHDTRSASKTFASVMMDAAMRQGDPIAPDSSIYALLAREGPFANPDPRKARITVGELMTHTSGLDCNDNDDASPGNEDRMQSQRRQPDWWKYTLDLPVAFDPGTHYAYCSAGMNLVGGALAAASGTWLPALFDRLVAQPLQYGRYSFNLMPDRQGYQGGGVRLRPRDLLKLGQVYLDGGVWNGRRVVDSTWVMRSTTRQGGGPDGFAWHLNTLTWNGRSYREFEANGNGGQFLIVLPELDLAVVFTAGNYGQYGVWRLFRDELVPQGIIAAVRRP